MTKSKAAEPAAKLGHNSGLDPAAERAFVREYASIKEVETEMAEDKGKLSGCYKRLENFGFTKDDIKWAKDLEKKKRQRGRRHDAAPARHCDDDGPRRRPAVQHVRQGPDPDRGCRVHGRARRRQTAAGELESLRYGDRCRPELAEGLQRGQTLSRTRRWPRPSTTTSSKVQISTMMTPAELAPKRMAPPAPRKMKTGTKRIRTAPPPNS